MQRHTRGARERGEERGVGKVRAAARHLLPRQVRVGVGGQRGGRL